MFSTIIFAAQLDTSQANNTLLNDATFIDLIKQILVHASELFKNIDFLTTLVFGFFLGIMSYKIYTKSKLSIKSTGLDNAVLIITTVLAITLILGTALGIINSSQFGEFGNFYVSFIFAWLLTKKSTRNEVTKEYEDKAEISFRHLQQLKSEVDQYRTVTNHKMTAAKNGTYILDHKDIEMVTIELGSIKSEMDSILLDLMKLSNISTKELNLKYENQILGMYDSSLEDEQISNLRKYTHNSASDEDTPTTIEDGQLETATDNNQAN